MGAQLVAHRDPVADQILAGTTCAGEFVIFASVPEAVSAPATSLGAGR